MRRKCQPHQPIQNALYVLRVNPYCAVFDFYIQGTALFMSIEVHHHAYRFLCLAQQQIKETDPMTLDDVYEKTLEPLQKDADVRSDTSTDESYTQPVFRHNPLHDVESLWWLLVYLTLYRSVNLAEDTQDRRNSQMRFYRQFFIDRNSRSDAFTQPHVFMSGLKYLHPSLHPVAHALEKFRRRLIARYTEVESGDIDAIDHTVAANVSGRAWRDIRVLAQKFSEDKDLELIPIRLSRYEKEPGPAEPAPPAIGGPSLDSTLLPVSKKRALDEHMDVPDKNTGNWLGGTEASSSGQSSKRKKRQSTAQVETKKSLPIRKSRSTSGKRKESSDSPGETSVTLRRSQRKGKSKFAKT
jgi:hypothetical protein